MRRPLLMFRTPNAYGPFWQRFGGKLAHTLGNYFGTGGTGGTGVIETFSDDFSSGDFSKWNTPIAWGDNSTNTIVPDGSGGYYYVAHADKEVVEGTPGKAYVSRDFATKMNVGDQIRIWCTFQYTTPVDGDGNLFDLDVEERIDIGPGVRLIVIPTGHIKVNCAKIAQPDIIPQASYPISPYIIHTIEWTFTASVDGHSKLTVDGNVVHDVDHPMQPPPDPYGDVYYEYVQIGITANSHSTEKEMIVYEAGFEIS